MTKVIDVDAREAGDRPAASLARVAANRRNALASTGPRTLAGKATAARNALHHGLRATAIVLPNHERVDDWEAHRDGVVASLAPADYLERELAERVAALTWRLRRVVGYETAAVVAAPAADEQVDGGRDVAQTRATALDLHADLAALDLEARNAPVSRAVANLVRESIWRATFHDDALPDDAPGPTTRDALLAFCRAHADDGTHVVRIWNDARKHIVEIAKFADRALGAASRRGTRVLPTDEALARAARQETHLQRCLARTLAELRALQARHAKLPNEPNGAPSLSVEAVAQTDGNAGVRVRYRPNA